MPKQSTLLPVTVSHNSIEIINIPFNTFNNLFDVTQYVNEQCISNFELKSYAKYVALSSKYQPLTQLLPFSHSNFKIPNRTEELIFESIEPNKIFVHPIMMFKILFKVDKFIDHFTSMITKLFDINNPINNKFITHKSLSTKLIDDKTFFAGTFILNKNVLTNDNYFCLSQLMTSDFSNNWIRSNPNPKDNTNQPIHYFSRHSIMVAKSKLIEIIKNNNYLILQLSLVFLNSIDAKYVNTITKVQSIKPKQFSRRKININTITASDNNTTTFCESLVLANYRNRFLVNDEHDRLQYFSSYANYIMGTNEQLIIPINNSYSIHPFLVTKLLLLDEQCVIYLGNEYLKLLNPSKIPLGIPIEFHRTESNYFNFSKLLDIIYPNDYFHDYAVERKDVTDWLHETVNPLVTTKYLHHNNITYVHNSFLLGVLSYSELFTVQMSIFFQDTNIFPQVGSILHQYISRINHPNNILDHNYKPATETVSYPDVLPPQLPIIIETQLTDLTNDLRLELPLSSQYIIDHKSSTKYYNIFSHKLNSKWFDSPNASDHIIISLRDNSYLIHFLHPSDIFKALFWNTTDQTVIVSHSFFTYLKWIFLLSINPDTQIIFVKSFNEHILTMNILTFDIDIILDKHQVPTDYFNPLPFTSDPTQFPRITNEFIPHINKLFPILKDKYTQEFLIDNKPIICYHLIFLLKIIHTYSDYETISNISTMLMHYYTGGTNYQTKYSN